MSCAGCASCGALWEKCTLYEFGPRTEVHFHGTFYCVLGCRPCPVPLDTTYVCPEYDPPKSAPETPAPGQLGELREDFSEKPA